MSGSQHPGHPLKGPFSRVCLSWHILEGPSSVQKALFHSDCWGQSGVGLGSRGEGQGREGLGTWAGSIYRTCEGLFTASFSQEASCHLSEDHKRQRSRVWTVPWTGLFNHKPCGFTKRAEIGWLGFRGKWGWPLAGAWAGWRPHRTVPLAGLPQCASSKSWDPNAPSCESPSLTSVVASVLLVNFQMAPVPLKATVGPCVAPAYPLPQGV